jgi:xanthine dehydrogenase YagR molybdenum-binding subunit
VRDIGEIGITAIGAAIVNPVYHDKGMRVRALPVTKNKILA